MPQNATMSGLIEKFANSYDDLKTARELLGRIEEQITVENINKIFVARAISRAISALKKRTERQYALEANHARSLSTEAKREKKLDEASENFYSRTREIRDLETLFRRRF